MPPLLHIKSFVQSRETLPTTQRLMVRRRWDGVPELPPNEIPVGVEKAKAGFPSECSPVTRERSLSITGVSVYCDPTSELEGPSPQRRAKCLPFDG
ncbi:hypothetical protein Tco_1396341 [Tanacetum coccineum]